MSRFGWRLAPYRAPFARAIATAHGPWHERLGLWLACDDGQGLTGLGEAAPLPEWGTESLEEAEAALRALGTVEVAQAEEVVPALTAAGLSREHTPAAFYAAELALLDALARQGGLPLARLLGAKSLGSVPVNALLTAITPEAAAAEARERVAAGYRALKLKVGLLPLAGELARLKAVREAVGEGVSLRLDANAAWQRETAREALLAFAALAPEYVEQPLAADDFEGLAWLAAETGVPVAADEAVRDAASARKLLAAGVPVLVVKPTALGGLAACGAIAREAAERGASVVLTSALDRGIATLGALHLAAALGAERPQGLATAGLFAGRPLWEGLLPQGGRLALPDGPGLCAARHEELVRELVPTGAPAC